MTVLEIIFWASAGLLAYTHLGYPVALELLARLRRTHREPEPEELPSVSVIIAAHDEVDVIARKVADARAQDYPADRVEVIVASDGSSDDTAELARRAGADVVLDLERCGKIAAQNRAVESARGEVLAFSDANAEWEPTALRRLVAPFSDPKVAYACGQVRFLGADGGNEEGAYWAYEMRVRRRESDLAGVTAGNGAIYAVRASAYEPLGSARSHDLSFPFAFAKRGLRSVYVPGAVAREKMVPSLEGEFARKRRMMRGIWDIVLRDGMLVPRGYSPLYAFEIYSHRALRYASPLLHLLALASSAALAPGSTPYAVLLGAQLALLVAAALAGALPLRLLRIARYYVLVTASIALGLWDRARLGTPGAWERAEGTR